MTAKNATTSQDFFKTGQTLQGDNNNILGPKDVLLESGFDFHSQMHKTQSLFNLPSLHKNHNFGSTITSGFNIS